MLSADFAANYCPDQASERRWSDDVATAMEPCKEWSWQLGSLLHDGLRGEQLDPKKSFQLLQRYDTWLKDEFAPINRVLLTKTTDEGMHASTEVNFHRLSASLIHQWLFGLSADKAAGAIGITRQQANRASRYLVAIGGINYCLERSRKSEIASDYEYLKADNAPVRKHKEALLTEYDAGSILLGMAQRRPGMVILPAPAQFGHGPHKRFNVNFVVWDMRRQRAVGVQVQSFAKSKIQNEYDDSIVLLGGNDDIANTVYHRDTPGTTIDHSYTWGGMVCAQYVLTTKISQQVKDMKQINVNYRSVVRNQALARGVIGKYAVRTDKSIATVDAKVQAKL